MFGFENRQKGVPEHILFIPSSFHLQNPLFFNVFFILIFFYIFMLQELCFCRDVHRRSTPLSTVCSNDTVFFSCYFRRKKKKVKRKENHPAEGGLHVCVCFAFIHEIQFDAALQEIKSKGTMRILIQALQLVFFFIPSIFFYLFYFFFGTTTTTTWTRITNSK